MYNKFFKSSLHFGSCKLLSSKLRLGEKKILPFSIPHGVDFGYNGDFVIDGTSIEPIYLAHSDYIFSKANKTLPLFPLSLRVMLRTSIFEGTTQFFLTTIKILHLRQCKTVVSSTGGWNVGR